MAFRKSNFKPFETARSRLGSFRKERRCQFLPPLLWRLPKAYTWSPTVLVDELHASLLKGSSYDVKGRATWLAPLLFELVDGHDADARSISQVLLAPT
jgi:hypothetical protein